MDAALAANSRRVNRRFPELSKAALRQLRIPNAEEEHTDLRVPPGNRLERLKGDRQGQHSIRINSGSTSKPSTISTGKLTSSVTASTERSQRAPVE